MSQSSWLDFKALGIGTVCLFCEYQNKTDEKRRHKKLFFFIFSYRYLIGGGVSDRVDLFGSARNQSLPGHVGKISGDVL